MAGVGITKWRQTYERWWLGKLCRPALSSAPFKRVVKVEVAGPPSFVYGGATLHYEDGRYDHVYQHDAFRPRKKDVEVQAE